MKTLEILETPEQELAPVLRSLKLKELERHAEKLIEKHGKAKYSNVMHQVIRAVPSLQGEGAERFLAVQGLIKELLGQSIADKEKEKILLERIAVLVMVIISKKFDQIHNG